jgi:hypothetical protein
VAKGKHSANVTVRDPDTLACHENFRTARLCEIPARHFVGRKGGGVKIFIIVNVNAVTAAAANSLQTKSLGLGPEDN